MAEKEQVLERRLKKGGRRCAGGHPSGTKEGWEMATVSPEQSSSLYAVVRGVSPMALVVAGLFLVCTSCLDTPSAQPLGLHVLYVCDCPDV